MAVAAVAAVAERDLPLAAVPLQSLRASLILISTFQLHSTPSPRPYISDTAPLLALRIADVRPWSSR
jgi:hypothetical protein